jgi:hypothetical protein
MRVAALRRVWIVPLLAGAFALADCRRAGAGYLPPPPIQPAGAGFVAMGGDCQATPIAPTVGGACATAEEPTGDEFPLPAEEPIGWPSAIRQLAIFFGILGRGSQSGNRPGGRTNSHGAVDTSPAIADHPVIVGAPPKTGSISVQSMALPPDPWADRLFRPPKLA